MSRAKLTAMSKLQATAEGCGLMFFSAMSRVAAEDSFAAARLSKLEGAKRRMRVRLSEMTWIPSRRCDSIVFHLLSKLL